MDGELDGFQIREVSDRGTAGLTLEAIALQSREYKIREGARVKGIPHFAVQRIVRKALRRGE